MTMRCLTPARRPPGHRSRRRSGAPGDPAGRRHRHRRAQKPWPGRFRWRARWRAPGPRALPGAGASRLAGRAGAEGRQGLPEPGEQAGDLPGAAAPGEAESQRRAPGRAARPQAVRCDSADLADRQHACQPLAQAPDRFQGRGTLLPVFQGERGGVVAGECVPRVNGPARSSRGINGHTRQRIITRTRRALISADAGALSG